MVFPFLIFDMNYPQPFLNYCASTSLKLTSLRRSVLYELWVSKKPLKAYEIVASLISIKQNSKPTSVYRALDYFLTCRIVHKIESIQAFTLCHEPEKGLPTEMLMVCNRCHQVLEVYDKAIAKLIRTLSKVYHFQIGQDAIELRGSCRSCSESVSNL